MGCVTLRVDIQFSYDVDIKTRPTRLVCSSLWDVSVVGLVQQLDVSKAYKALRHVSWQRMPLARTSVYARTAEHLARSFFRPTATCLLEHFGMILDAEATTHLKPWLVRTLEPMCVVETGLSRFLLILFSQM